MQRFTTFDSKQGRYGEVHMVRLPENCSVPSWLVHAQVELDGKRVFVRMIDDGACHGAGRGAVGLVVSPVY